MADMVPRRLRDVIGMREPDFLPRVPGRIQRAVERETGYGLVRAARAEADTYVAHTRVDGAAFVARTGLRQVAELTAEESRYLEQTPSMTAAVRYRAIGDAFAALVADEVSKLGFER